MREFRSESLSFDRISFSHLDHDIRETISNNYYVLKVFFFLFFLTVRKLMTTSRTSILLKLHSLGLRGQLPWFLAQLLTNRTILVHWYCFIQTL